jgi:hypothetical protein
MLSHKKPSTVPFGILFWTLGQINKTGWSVSSCYPHISYNCFGCPDDRSTCGLGTPGKSVRGRKKKANQRVDVTKVSHWGRVLHSLAQRRGREFKQFREKFRSSKNLLQTRLRPDTWQIVASHFFPSCCGPLVGLLSSAEPFVETYHTHFFTGGGCRKDLYTTYVM